MELGTNWLISYYQSLHEQYSFNDDFFSPLQATMGIWNAGKNNMGFGFNRDTWNLIKDCAEVGII